MTVRPIKLAFAGFALGLLTQGLIVLVLSFVFDPNAVGDLFEKVFLPCQIALTIAWALTLRGRLR